MADVRFGFRTLLKDRSFFLTAVVTLALGIGSTTAIFSVIDNVLLRPFPYTEGERIFGIAIHDRNSTDPYGRNYFSIPEFLDYQQQNHIFDQSMGIWEETTLMGGPDHPEPFDTDTVTGNTFQFLGVPALLGRGILPSDAQPGAPPVFVLSYKVWSSRFGLDPTVVGKTFIMNDKPTMLVGIMPLRFAFWGGDLWMPFSLDRAQPDAARRQLVMYGRLKPGLDPKAAEADIGILARRSSKLYPTAYPKDFSVRVQSLVDVAGGQFKNTLFTLLAAVSLLLLIACANVTNLLLAKAAGREKELALRMTLGAGRFRVIRQLIVESVLLAIAGAALGCLFAWVGLKGLIAILPQFTFPDEAVIDLNTPVLFATLATAVVTAVIFGLTPALSASRRDFNEALKSSGRGNSSFRRGRLRNILVVGEVALSLLLLIGAGLLMRSFFAQRQVDLGMRTDHLLITGLNLPPNEYKSTDSQSRFLRELLPRLQSLPGVISAAGAVNGMPIGRLSTDFEIDGITHPEVWRAHMVPCNWQLFQTVRLNLVAGRLLSSADDNGKRKVAVINRTMATKYFGRQDPIGHHILLSGLKAAPDPVDDPSFEIVGVVSDTKNDGVRKPAAPEVYVPYTVAGYGTYTIFLHTVGNPAALTRAFEGEILRLDRTIVPQQTLTMDQFLELTEYGKPRFGLILFSVFAGIGLALVSVGVYSVISYTVTQQRHEIGIRMALGAGTRDVRSLVIRSSLRFISAGIAIGALLVCLMSRVLASEVWGVSWYDPITLGGVVVILTVVGLTASYLPSLRATRVDPAICLRYD
jgi:putative ABC transport system permease protein